VELAPITDPILLLQEILRELGIKEEPKKALEETLTGYLKDKEILIILDNCEHLIEACADLTEKLLTTCPKLKIIATSREALKCTGEQTHSILSLKTPDLKKEISLVQLTQYESVRLFIDRALAVNQKFKVTNENAPALAGICSRLDGIPLAIELAAARIKVLTVERIYKRLNSRFSLLTGGKRTALPRQQTLKALIDWSYDLLSDQEKILWRRLSVEQIIGIY
jgi:predicted ATPase